MLIKIANIVLSFLLLATTTGFAISKHYCGGSLVSVAINVDVKPCCDDEKGNCCHNESEYFTLEEDFAISFTQFNFENPLSIDLKLIQNSFLNINKETEITSLFVIFSDTLPPPKIQTVLAKLQAYLL